MDSLRAQFEQAVRATGAGNSQNFPQQPPPPTATLPMMPQQQVAAPGFFSKNKWLICGVAGLAVVTAIVIVVLVNVSARKKRERAAEEAEAEAEARAQAQAQMSQPQPQAQVPVRQPQQRNVSFRDPGPERVTPVLPPRQQPEEQEQRVYADPRAGAFGPPQVPADAYSDDNDPNFTKL